MPAIDDFLNSRASEELFLDFKRSADNGIGRTLHDTDRKNYAKAISGFANSEGGVIVWGIDCRSGPDGADVARALHPLNDVRGFLSRLEGATSGCTVPACPNVEHSAIETEGIRGFVITHIPKSHLAPHQCLKPQNYFVRAGSDFIAAPHGLLQGLFGRRSAPAVFHMWGLEPARLQSFASGNSVVCTVGVMLATFGPGIVRDAFLNVYASAPGGGSTVAYEFFEPQRWNCHTFLGRAYAIAVDGFKLAPEAMAMPIKTHVTLKPPFTSDWRLVILY